MGLNPFGDESDSLHAWKERYKQQQFQIQSLQSQLGEKKSTLKQLQVKFEEKSRQLRERESELSSVRQDLKVLRELQKDREHNIQKLERKLEESKIDLLEGENRALKDRVENLQGIINRSGGPNSFGSSSINDGSITSALIPVMLQEFDPGTHSYEDAFINLVESVIEDGETMARIVAILIKYGGRGPKHKVKEMINSKEFDIVVKTLIEGGIINEVGNEIVIGEGEVRTTTDIDNLSTGELFSNMIEIAENSSDETLISSLKKFRDTLQNREVPLTTIFFEIRKMIERIQKQQISRNDLINQIENWQHKYESLA